MVSSWVVNQTKGLFSSQYYPREASSRSWQGRVACHGPHDQVGGTKKDHHQILRRRRDSAPTWQSVCSCAFVLGQTVRGISRRRRRVGISWPGWLCCRDPWHSSPFQITRFSSLGGQQVDVVCCWSRTEYKLVRVNGSPTSWKMSFAESAFLLGQTLKGDGQVDYGGAVLQRNGYYGAVLANIMHKTRA